MRSGYRGASYHASQSRTLALLYLGRATRRRTWLSHFCSRKKSSFSSDGLSHLSVWLLSQRYRRGTFAYRRNRGVEPVCSRNRRSSRSNGWTHSCPSSCGNAMNPDSRSPYTTRSVDNCHSLVAFLRQRSGHSWRDRGRAPRLSFRAFAGSTRRTQAAYDSNKSDSNNGHDRST